MNATSFLGSKIREDELIQALALELKPALEKAASVKTEGTEPATDVLASVVSTLVKCADKLDEVGHPAADKVDAVLAFIDAELFTKAAKAKAKQK